MQHIVPHHLEVEGHLEVPRLDQLEDPLVRRLGRAAQRRARGGELCPLRKVQHGGRRPADDAPEEGVEFDHLVVCALPLAELPELGLGLGSVCGLGSVLGLGLVLRVVLVLGVRVGVRVSISVRG